MDSTPTAPAASQSENMPIMVLSWIFAPLVSLFFVNHQDADVKWHAKQSLWFGVADIVIQIGLWVVSFVFGVTLILAPLALLTGLASTLWWLVSLVVRIYGAYQAYQGKRWAVPVLSNYVK